MPTEDRLRFHDHHGIEQLWEKLGHASHDHSVPASDAGLRFAALEDNDLLTQEVVLRHQRCPGSNEVAQEADRALEEVSQHGASLRPAADCVTSARQPQIACLTQSADFLRRTGGHRSPA